MLGQILVNTPSWVWALLAFLIYRGMLASVDREISLRKTFIIPLVMLALSIQGIASTFGNNASAALIWFVCAIATSALNWQFFNRGNISAHPERGVIFRKGSWTPLVLMMGIFLTKYSVAVTLARHPDYARNEMFVATICVLYGVFNGIFIGNLLRIVALYRQAAAVPSAAAVESFSRSTGQTF